MTEIALSYEQFQDLLDLVVARRWAFATLLFSADTSLHCRLVVKKSLLNPRMRVDLRWAAEKANQNTQKPGEWRIDKMEAL